VKNALANKELSFDLLKGLVTTPITTGLNFALLAPPGAGKTTICQSLLKEAVEAGLRCLYVITNNPISLIKEQVRALGPAPGRADQIIYVDMYSWLLGERSQERFQKDNA